MSRKTAASSEKMDSRGFIYVANRRPYVREAALSAQSVRSHHKLPVCLITTPDMECDEGAFDIIIRCEDIAAYTFESKTFALKLSPFERAVFLDADTFVCASMNELFDVLDLSDMACTIEARKHTIDLKRFSPSYANVFPEFNTGVIAFRKSAKVQKFADAWLMQCKKLNTPLDMPAFRETLLESEEIKIITLPQEYNLHGFASMVIIDGEAKILHERFGRHLFDTTRYMEGYDVMSQRASRINRTHVKRLYIPYLGIVPYNWSPENIIRKLKLMLGAKPVSRSRL